jgi:trehalose 6-phosphate synthase
MPPPLIVASNRGPVSFVRAEDGRVEVRRGQGGLVTALTGALEASGGLWVAAAMTEEDRRQAVRGGLDVEGAVFRVRSLSFEPDVYDGFYNGISNRLLWFAHHELWDLPREPRFGSATRAAWRSYVAVNEAFAACLAEEAEALPGPPAYLVQDYHLSLVPAMLRELRPRSRIAHFSHIPFANPDAFRIIPAELRSTLLRGLLGADVVGFHAARWARNFLLGCRDLVQARVDLHRRVVHWEGRVVRVAINPISIDSRALRAQASEPGPVRAARALRSKVGHAGAIVLRVDRTDLSKNILRGLAAFETLLRDHPEWRERVVHVALLNPSRQDVPEYRRYTADCVREGRRINRELGTPAWQPVHVRLHDDYAEALGAYREYDVLLVNPVVDGMNLVAKEGPVLNERDGVLVLSENAGAHAELGPHALTINPFDVQATADAIHRGLCMDPGERARRAQGLRAAVRRNRLEAWVERQLSDVDRSAPP